MHDGLLSIWTEVFIPSPSRDRPALALIEDRKTPSPLAGEGWDGGDVDGESRSHMPLDTRTPAFSLAREN